MPSSYGLYICLCHLLQVGKQPSIMLSQDILQQMVCCGVCRPQQRSEDGAQPVSPRPSAGALPAPQLGRAVSNAASSVTGDFRCPGMSKRLAAHVATPQTPGPRVAYFFLTNLLFLHGCCACSILHDACIYQPFIRKDTFLLMSLGKVQVNRFKKHCAALSL